MIDRTAMRMKSKLHVRNWVFLSTFQIKNTCHLLSASNSKSVFILSLIFNPSTMNWYVEIETNITIRFLLIPLILTIKLFMNRYRFWFFIHNTFWVSPVDTLEVEYGRPRYAVVTRCSVTSTVQHTCSPQDRSLVRPAGLHSRSSSSLTVTFCE